MTKEYQPLDTCLEEDRSNETVLPRHTDHDATASSFSSIINLANTILGTGMLAMPAAMASVGLIPGAFIILFHALTAAAGLYFLTRCAALTKGRRASFFAISKLTWPRLAVVFDMAIAVKCLGVAISYLIIIGDLMPQVMVAFMDKNIPSVLVDRRFWITLFMVFFILPLSFLRKLDSLKYTSIIALIAAVYLCVIVVYYYVSPADPFATDEKIDYFNITTDLLKHLPIFIFAFTCHQNIFSVYNELKDNSKKNMAKVIAVSIGCSAVVYQSIAIIGYLSFGKEVHGNIIVEYPSSYFVAGGRLAIVILVVFGYSLQAHPCRSSLDTILRFGNKDGTSPFKYYVMTTTILILSYIVAISVTRLETVLTFVGSTGSTIISFILPGLFYFKLHENDAWTWSKVCAVLLSVYGIFVMCVCLTYNTMQLLR